MGVCALCAHSEDYYEMKVVTNSDEEPCEYPTVDIECVPEPCARPFLVFWEAAGRWCRVYTPAAWWRTRWVRFTLLLTMVWNAYAHRDGEERIHLFRLLFGAGMMGGQVRTHSSIAAVLAQTIFSAVQPSTTRT